MENINQRRGTRLLNNNWVFDDYPYFVSRRKNGITYLICKYHRNSHCPGRGSIRRDGTFLLTTEHSHLPNVNAEGERSFRRELYRGVQTQPSLNRQIYERIRQFHGNAEIGVPFVSVQTSMYRWRNTHVPPAPDSLRFYTEYLNNEEWNTLCRYEEGSLTFTLASGHENTSVIILDPNFARVLLQNGEFYIHLSKKAIPSAVGAVQLLSLMRLWNSYIIPCAWALMDSATEESYITVFQCIKIHCPQFSIQKAVLTFGRALQLSIQQEFPGALIYGSLFHFHEELYKKAIELSLDHYIHTSGDEIQKIILRIMALPLLPAAQIPIAFDSIKNEVSAENISTVEEFLNYVQEKWLQGVHPQVFSMNEMLERTTNIFEFYGSRLECKVGTNTEIWTWTKCIVSLQQRVFHDKRRIGEGLRGGVQSPKLLNQGTVGKLRRAWTALHEGNMSIEEFLTMASYICVEQRTQYLHVYLESHTANEEPLELINRLHQNLEMNSNDTTDDEDNTVDDHPEIDMAPQNHLVPQIEEQREQNNPEEEENTEAINNNDNKKCCICRLNDATHAFVPCGHQSICQECTTVYNVINNHLRCPMCRASSQMIIRIFV